MFCLFVDFNDSLCVNMVLIDALRCAVTNQIAIENEKSHIVALTEENGAIFKKEKHMNNSTVDKKNEL